MEDLADFLATRLRVNLSGNPTLLVELDKY